MLWTSYRGFEHTESTSSSAELNSAMRCLTIVHPNSRSDPGELGESTGGQQSLHLLESRCLSNVSGIKYTLSLLTFILPIRSSANSKSNSTFLSQPQRATTHLNHEVPHPHPLHSRTLLRGFPFLRSLSRLHRRRQRSISSRSRSRMQSNCWHDQCKCYGC